MALERSRPLTFGVFTPPIVRPDANPTLAFERMLELTEWFERVGYDEAWFGEHHNGGWELIGAPEVFIAAAAQRTRRIRLATGVTTIPYHHPFLVAERMVMLDHLTRGRVILGVGPGSLAFDAHVLGLDYQDNRRKLAEGLEAIMLLLESEAPVTMRTDWFALQDAQLHLRPFTRPHFEIAAAATASPVGPRLAGRHGISLVTIAASSPKGFEALEGAWAIAEAEALRHGRSVDRATWRLVSFFHLADTEAQARADVRFGLTDLLRYMGFTTPMVAGLSDIHDVDRTIDELNASGLMVIGTPDRLTEHLRSFQRQSGGFGGFLGFGTEMADLEATKRSHELLMDRVAPHFQDSTQRQQQNFQHVQGLRTDWVDQVKQAQRAVAPEARPDPRPQGVTSA